MPPRENGDTRVTEKTEKNRKCERRENNYGKEKKGDKNKKEEYIKEHVRKLEEQE
jgi:hypothetical protein